MNIRSAKHCLRALLDYFWVRRMPVILITTLLAGGKQTRTPILSPRLIQLLVLLLFLFPALSRARSVSQEKEREPLGSDPRRGGICKRLPGARRNHDLFWRQSSYWRFRLRDIQHEREGFAQNLSAESSPLLWQI